MRERPGSGVDVALWARVDAARGSADASAARALGSRVPAADLLLIARDSRSASAISTPVEPDQLSLRADAASVYGDQRAEYLAQLVAPMDDMWAAFADMAAPHALRVGDEVVGSALHVECSLGRKTLGPRR